MGKYVKIEVIFQIKHVNREKKLKNEYTYYYCTVADFENFSKGVQNKYQK